MQNEMHKPWGEIKLNRCPDSQIGQVNETVNPLDFFFIFGQEIWAGDDLKLLCWFCKAKNVN